MRPNITELVVEQDLCIGCGICDSVCPVDVLKMVMNDIGEYVPTEIPGCLDKCTFCLDACPFLDGNDDEEKLGSYHYSGNENIRYQFETGYYLSSYACHVENDEQRLRRASGGVTTWLLQTLLEKDIVDYVVTLSANDDPEKLFKYEIYSDTSFVDESPGSVYYPVEMSEVLREIQKIPGRYAITGLPCFIKAIRLAQKTNKKLRDRIKVTIGLTCGQMKSAKYTEYLASVSGVDGKLEKVHYRGKSIDKPASNFFFSSQNQAGKSEKLFWSEGIDKAWVNRWFTPNACDYCDDVFGETADVSVMDAWLPEYMHDSKGNSLVLIRNSEIDSLFKEASDNKELQVKDIEIKKIIKSQEGVLHIKRNHLSYRLQLAKKRGEKVLQKRVKPSSRMNFFVKKEIEIKREMQHLSKLYIRENKSMDIGSIQNIMQPHIGKLNNVRQKQKIALFPGRVVKKIIKIIKEVNEK